MNEKWTVEEIGEQVDDDTGKYVWAKLVSHDYKSNTPPPCPSEVELTAGYKQRLQQGGGGSSDE